MSQQALAQAAMMMVKGDYEGAIGVCNAALAQDPRNVPVLNMKLTVLFANLQRYQEALPVCEQVLALTRGFEHIEALHKRGWLMKKLGNVAEAENAAKWILHLGGDDPRGFERAASLYQILAREADVIATYDAGIRKFPRDVELYEKRGLYLHALKQYLPAVQTYDAVLAFAPQNESLWYNRGCSLARMGNAQAAVESLWRSIQLQTSNRETAKKDPDFEVIANDPGYRQLVGL